MKLFISWSGEKSKSVANLLSEWICVVVQAVEPWISTQDIDKGKAWFGEITKSIDESTLGIACVTQSNKEKPWLLFEAGALAVGKRKHLLPLLVDLKPSDLSTPLSMYQLTEIDYDDMLKLVKLINRNCVKIISIKTLETSFKVNWGDFKNKFDNIMNNTFCEEIKKENDSNQLLRDDALDIVNLIQSGQLHDFEYMLFNYLIDNGKTNLFCGWKESEEIKNIKEWESRLNLDNELSNNYKKTLDFLKTRQLIEVSELTSGGYPREFKLVNSVAQKLLYFDDETKEILKLKLNAHAMPF